MKFPKIPYKLFLLGPAATFIAGALLNKIAIGVNNGAMPVQMKDCSISETYHVCMTIDTHLKFLCDWILMNHGSIVASPGDILVWTGNDCFLWGILIWILFTIRDYNRS